MKTRAAVLVAALLLVVASAACAEAPTGWKTEIAGVVWLAGIEGTVTVDGQETEFDKSAGDLFEYTEFAAGLFGSAQYNRWVALCQLDYFTLSTDALDVEDRPVGGSMSSDILLTELGAGYQINGWREGQTFDLLVALRIYSAKNDLEVYGEGGGTYSADSDLIDPMIAVRGKLPLSPSKAPGLYFTALAGIGGGGDSQLIYELQPQLRYEINESIFARVGYRRVGWQVESDDGSKELDFTLGGLNFGLGVTF